MCIEESYIDYFSQFLAMLSCQSCHHLYEDAFFALSFPTILGLLVQVVFTERHATLDHCD